MRLLLHNIQYGTGRLRRFAAGNPHAQHAALPNITRFLRHMILTSSACGSRRRFIRTEHKTKPKNWPTISITTIATA